MTEAFILSLAMVAGAPEAAITRTLDHHSGPLTAEYRGTLLIEETQVGTVAPPGRPSTLRCSWTAHLNVDRTAMGAEGIVASRTFTRSNIAQGSRPGWCRGQSDARTSVADRVDHTAHLAAAADEDEALLAAELDRIVQSRG